MTYDLIIIGGGPAGYCAAERAGHAGLSTLLVEKKSVGGVCLNEGCIPTKTLLHSARLFDGAKHGETYGIKASGVTIDHAAVVERKNRVVKALVSGVVSRLRKNKVRLLEGAAEISGRSADGFSVVVGGETCSGKRLLIATGSEAAIPRITGINEGIDGGYVVTSRELLDATSVPESLVVIGGGVIGLELASYFNSAGSSVTVIEILDHIAGDTDREISSVLKKNYEKKGISFLLSAKAIDITRGSVTYEMNGEKLAIRADTVLVSTGRKPVADGFGLKNIGVETEHGRIKTDVTGKTNVQNVYAAGDVNGVSMLAHTAYREAEVCVNDMLGARDRMRYEAIPQVIYTNPEVAGVGETGESAKAKGIDFDARTISMRYSGRYVVEEEGGDGICKTLVDGKRGRLIGFHMIGNHSSEIIYGAAMMIETEMRVRDIKELVFPHPSVSEIIRESIFQF